MINYYDQPTVYTFYDADMRPLYVGKSYQLGKRLLSHQKNNEHFSSFVFLGVQQYNSRTDADLAELIEIHNKKPLYNKASKYNGEELHLDYGGLVQEKIMPIKECPIFSSVSTHPIQTTVFGKSRSPYFKNLWRTVYNFYTSGDDDSIYFQIQKSDRIGEIYCLFVKGEFYGYCGAVKHQDVPLINNFLASGAVTRVSQLEIKILDMKLDTGGFDPQSYWYGCDDTYDYTYTLSAKIEVYV